MKDLQHKNTWYLVSLPTGKRAIGCKWLYTIKMNLDGSVVRLKARPIAKGYAQIYGVDYTDTFPSVTKISSIRIIISLVAKHRWPLFQLDVNNVFLHVDLQEEVYMEKPHGFISHGDDG